MSFGSKSLPRPTVSEQRRIKALVRIGCIACAGTRCTETCGRVEYNHVLVGGLRVGHRYGYPLCGWHHQRIIKEGWTAEQMLVTFGPSLRSGSRPFHDAFGTDQQLQDVADKIIGWPIAKIPARAAPSSRKTGKTGYSRGNSCASTSKTFKRGQT